MLHRIFRTSWRVSTSNMTNKQMWMKDWKSNYDLIIRWAVTVISKLPTAPKCFWRYPNKKIIKPWSSRFSNVTWLWSQWFSRDLQKVNNEFIPIIRQNEEYKSTTYEIWSEPKKKSSTHEICMLIWKDIRYVIKRNLKTNSMQPYMIDRIN